MAVLPWFAEPFARLVQQREQGRLGHAWLVRGPAGVGKMHFANEVARWLLCTRPGPQGGCGQCQDCHYFDVGTHPDWSLLQPEKRQITVGQVRDLIEQAQATSQRGMKVLVIAPAEAMNPNAANALLKILEEPPANTLLMLVSHQSGQLLATLRSRCQQLALDLPAHDTALAWLSAQQVPDAERLLFRARGAPLRALQLRDDDVLAGQDTVLAQMQALLRGDTSPIQAAKTCEKFAIQTSIEFMLECCRDLLGSLQAGLAPRDPDLAPLLADLRSFGEGQLLVQSLHGYQRQAQAAYRTAVAPNNANALLILEALMGDWTRMRERLRRANR